MILTLRPTGPIECRRIVHGIPPKHQLPFEIQIFALHGPVCRELLEPGVPTLCFLAFLLLFLGHLRFDKAFAAWSSWFLRAVLGPYFFAPRYEDRQVVADDRCAVGSPVSSVRGRNVSSLSIQSRTGDRW